MLSIEQIEAFYSYFYACKYSDRNYKLKSTKATKSVCGSFLSSVNKKYNLNCVGDTFLWDYFVFQWQYWEDLTFANKFTDRVVIAWIVGDKAFERWVKRDIEFDWQIEDSLFVDKYSLDKKKVLTKNPQPSVVDPGKHLSAIKKKNLNTPQGFALCVEYTTLFDPSDISCIRCNSRADCKELLRVNYPKLYRKRIN